MPPDRLVFLPSIHHAGPVTDKDWARLGREVIRTRARRDIPTAKALADLMGVSPRIVGEIENGRRASYSATTLAKLEHALGWAEGSIDSVLAGRHPIVELDAPAPQPSGGRRRAMVRLPASLYEASDAELLAEIARRFAREHPEQPETEGFGFHYADGTSVFPITDDFDLVADDAGGHDHETEDEDREIEP